MRSKPSLTVFGVLMLSPVLVAAQAQSPTEPDLPTRLASIEKAIEAQRSTLHIPGVALVIVKDDKIIYNKGFGLRDVGRSLPVTPDTLFSIGSSTKAFTAATVLMSEEEKKLSLADSPKKYLSYFKLSDPEADSKITLSDLLCHRCGLDRIDLPWYSGRLSSQETIRVAAEAKPTAKFGEKFQYQNIMFLVAGETVAKVQRKPWVSVVSERIFKPLGMSSSSTSIRNMQRSSDASLGYLWDEEKKEIVPLPYREINAIAPAGAIVSSSTDMAKWVRLMLGKGVFEGKRLFSEASYDKLTAVHQNVQGNVNYGYGWFLRDWNGHKVVEHGGNIDGFNAEVAFMPDQRIGFVLLTNVSSSPLAIASLDTVWENLIATPVKATEKIATALNPEKEVGNYRIELIKLNLTVTLKEGTLFCQPEGQPNLALQPQGGRKYQIAPPAPPKVYITFRPVKDSPSEVELVLEQSGQTFVASKNDGKPKIGAPKFDAGITIDDLMAKAIVAAGGEANLKRHKSMRYSFLRKMLNQGMEERGETRMMAPNSISSESKLFAVGKTIGKLRVYFDGASGGQETDFTSRTTISPDKIAETAVTADFYPELNWKKLYKTVVIKGKEKVGEEDAFLIEKTPEKGQVVMDYVSTKSFLVIRRDTTILSPFAGPLPASEVFSDFRTVGGVVIPFTHSAKQTGIGESVTQIIAVIQDERFPASMFQAKGQRK